MTCSVHVLTFMNLVANGKLKLGTRGLMFGTICFEVAVAFGGKADIAWNCRIFRLWSKACLFTPDKAKSVANRTNIHRTAGKLLKGQCSALLFICLLGAQAMAADGSKEKERQRAEVMMDRLEAAG